MSDYFLEHYGVVGMKWGKRKARGQLAIGGPTGSSSSKSSGGYNADAFKSSGKKGKTINAKYKEVNNDKSSGSSKSSSSSKPKGAPNPKPKDPKSSNGSTKQPESKPSKPPTKKDFNASEARGTIGAGKKLAETGAKKLSEERQQRHDKSLKSEARTMSDAELKKVADRLALEQRYVSAMQKEGVKEAKSNLEKTLEIAGAVATYADTALSVYEAIEKIRGR